MCVFLSLYVPGSCCFPVHICIPVAIRFRFMCVFRSLYVPGFMCVFHACECISDYKVTNFF